MNYKKIFPRIVAIVMVAILLASGLPPIDMGSVALAADYTSDPANAPEYLKAHYDALVLEEEEVKLQISKDFTLPSDSQIDDKGIATISWKTKDPSNPYLAIEDADGMINAIVTRPYAGEGNKEVELVATIAMGDDTIDKEFKVIIREGLTDDSMAGYIYTCFTNSSPVASGQRDVQQVHFFLSEDGLNWTVLNGGSPAFTAGKDYIDAIQAVGTQGAQWTTTLTEEEKQKTTQGDASVLFPFDGSDQGIRDPYIIKGSKRDGSDKNKTWILATDLNTMSTKYNGIPETSRVGNWSIMASQGSTRLFIYETEDWIHWERRWIDVAAPIEGGAAWAPEAIYDPENDNYIIYWSNRIGADNLTRNRGYCAVTEDFVTLGPTKLHEQQPNYLRGSVVANGSGNIDTSQLWVADPDDPDNLYDKVYRVVKDETNSKIYLMSADTVLDPDVNYDDTDPTRITSYTLDGTEYSTPGQLSSIPSESAANFRLKRGEIVWNWFKEEAVANHFQEIPSMLPGMSGSWEGATMFKFIDRNEWCIMIDNYSNTNRYTPFLSKDLSKPNSVVAPAAGTFGRTGSVGAHGGMVPITVAEYNTLIDTYNGDSSIINYQQIDYIPVDNRELQNAVDEAQAEVDKNETYVAGDIEKIKELIAGGNELLNTANAASADMQEVIAELETELNKLELPPSDGSAGTVTKVSISEDVLDLPGHLIDNAIKRELAKLVIRAELDTNESIVIANDTDWTLTKVSGGYTATKTVVLPEGYTYEAGTSEEVAVNVTSVMELFSIEVVKAPNKTSYYAGQFIDTTGLKVAIKYTDGTQKMPGLGDCKLQLANAFGLQSSRRDMTMALTATLGSIVISYEEGGTTVEVLQPITVTPRTVDAITIKTPPAKTTYQEGEVFDPAGMVVEASYSTGANQIVTGSCVSPATPLQSGTSVKITYTLAAKTVEAIVPIVLETGNPLKEIKTELTAADKVVPREGKIFKDSDITITAVFEDDTEVPLRVADCNITPNQFTTATTSANVAYTYDGVTKTAAVSGFTVTSPPEIIAQFDFDDETNGFKDGDKAKAVKVGADITLSDDTPFGEGKSVYLNGSLANTQYLNVTAKNGTPLLTGEEEISISYYAKINNVSGAHWAVYLAQNANVPTDRVNHVAMAQRTSGNRYSIERIWKATNGMLTLNSTADAATSWAHVVYVAAKDRTEIYVNGTSVASNTTITPKLTDILLDNSIFQIGKSNVNGGEYFRGYIDDFKVYGKALSSAEVQTLYTNNNKYTITATADTNGEVTDGGIYKHGAKVTLKATPDTGYEFDGWYEGDTKVSANVTYSFLATSNRTLQARFFKARYSVAVYTTTTPYYTSSITATGSRINQETESVYFALSKDGENYEVLNRGGGVIFAPARNGSYSANSGAAFGDIHNATGTASSSASSLRIRNPLIFYDTSKTEPFRVIATDYTAAFGYHEFTSANGVHFYNANRITPAQAGEENGPLADYNLETATLNKDDITLMHNGENLIEKDSNITLGNAIEISKEQYQFYLDKLAPVYNTGLESVDKTYNVAVNGTLTEETLQNDISEVTAEYSDGSSKPFEVDWSGALKDVDFTKPGLYEITGKVNQTRYTNKLEELNGSTMDDDDPDRKNAAYPENVNPETGEVYYDETKFVEGLADPQIFWDEVTGYYYMTGSYFPQIGIDELPGETLDYSSSQYDRIAIRRSRTLEGLQRRISPEDVMDKEATGQVTIWKTRNQPYYNNPKDRSTSPEGRNGYRFIWAPQIHRMGYEGPCSNHAQCEAAFEASGTVSCKMGWWVVYFTQSQSATDNYNIFSHCLVLPGHMDPFETALQSGTQTSEWINYRVLPKVATNSETGALLTNAQIQAANPRYYNVLTTAFNLDLDYFQNEVTGKSYLCLTGKPMYLGNGNTDLFIAEMVPQVPWEITTPETRITFPDYGWERISYQVNEGTTTIQRDGKIYVTYSASGTGSEYAIGMLVADATDDLLAYEAGTADANGRNGKAEAWTKSPFPVLTSRHVDGEEGPGHNSFTKDKDGNDIFVYHARPTSHNYGLCGGAGNPLGDPCRHARIKRVHWAADGTPIISMSYDDELQPENQTVTATVKVGAGVKTNITGVTILKDDEEAGSELTLDMNKGWTLQLGAAVTPDNATVKKTIWSSSDEGVAIVDQNGLVTLKKSGSVMITLTSADDPEKNDTVKLDIAYPSTSLRLSNTSVVAYTTSTPLTLTATVSPAGSDQAENKITWSSSDTQVATVENGTIVFVGKGAATITASLTGTSFTATCEVKVVDVLEPLELYDFNEFAQATVDGDSDYLSDGDRDLKLESAGTGTLPSLVTDAARGKVLQLTQNTYANRAFALLPSNPFADKSIEDGLTLNFWARVNTTSGSNPSVAQRNLIDFEVAPATTGRAGTVAVNQTMTYYNTTDQNGAYMDISTPYAWSANNWRMVTIVFTKTGVKAYANGSPITASASGSGAYEKMLLDLTGKGGLVSSPEETRVRFGASMAEYWGCAGGALDDVAFYGSALSDAQVSGLYNMTRNVSVPAATVSVVTDNENLIDGETKSTATLTASVYADETLFGADKLADSQEVEWSTTSNAVILTSNADGTCTVALAENAQDGTATIMATAKGTSIKGTVKLKIKIKTTEEIAKSKGNPITGFDQNGDQMYGGDPSFLVDGDTTYLYVGHDVSTNNSYNIPEWYAYSSKDMENWKCEGPVMSAARRNVPWAANDREAWAGQVIRHYDSAMGKDYYYFYHCMANPKNIGVGVADTPTGWSSLQAKEEYCTTKGINLENRTPLEEEELYFTDIGQPIVMNSITWPYGHAHDDIDPTVWIENDENGVERRYLQWGNTYVFTAELNDDMITVKDQNGDGLITMKTTRSLLTRDGNVALSYNTSGSGQRNNTTQLVERPYSYTSAVTYTDYKGTSYTIPADSSYPDGDIVVARFWTENKYDYELDTPYTDDARTTAAVDNDGGNLSGLLTYNDANDNPIAAGDTTTPKARLNGLFSFSDTPNAESTSDNPKYDPRYHFFTEAPYLYRRQDENGNYYGKYYMFFAVDWHEQMAYATTDDLWESTWEFQGIFMSWTGTSNTNHPSVFDFNGKTYFGYHNGSWAWGSGYRRIVCLEELIFDEDGLIQPIQQTATGLTGTTSWIQDLSGNYITHENFKTTRSDGAANAFFVGSRAKAVGMTGKGDIVDEGDARWEIIQGKADAGNPEYVSIESWNYPGLFLKVSMEDTNIVMAHQSTANGLTSAAQLSEATRIATEKEMTFKTVSGLNGKAGTVTFESVARPEMYLTSKDGTLILTDGSDKDACTFAITDRAALKSISAKKTKTSYYKGEQLSLSDITVELLRQDGTREEIKDYTIDASKVDMDVLGRNTISITYREDNFLRIATIEIDIQMSPESIKEIQDAIDTAMEEVAKAKEDAAQAKEDAAQAKEDAAQAKEDAAQAKLDAAQAKTEAAQAKEDAAQAKADAAQAKADAAQAKADAAQAKVAAAEAKADALQAQLDAAQAITDAEAAQERAIAAEERAIAAEERAIASEQAAETARIAAEAARIAAEKAAEAAAEAVRAQLEELADAAKKAAEAAEKARKAAEAAEAAAKKAAEELAAIQASAKQDQNAMTLMGRAVKIRSAKNSKKKQILLKLKKDPLAAGYQIQWAGNSKFKKPVRKNTTKVSYTIKSLKKGKTYYIRARAYTKNSKGKTVYGQWSKPKKVKVKK